ncbi:hypothetical protein SR870_06230 [Rhodopseudomonas palustris]|uniref:hypothetical protein n=1 Tax=Rhodopseudomonas palustris TaxID=1076 RepID=UPI002ACE6F72|nr:hypothetical protein [Rhodopseudomonas palustris]WQH00875.1 hypothetical protein SR870_06230 [Rhodopseudomonas palustris]
MALKRKTIDLDLARLHYNAARSRCARQADRVAAQIAEGRDAARAQALLAVLKIREMHSRSYLEAIKGWHRKHPHVRVAKSVKKRLRKRKLRDGKREDRTSQWDDQVKAALSEKLQNAPNYLTYVLELWDRYLALRLPNGHFVKEICSGDANKIAQRVWEMMLASHFDALGFSMTSADEGPDLRIEQDGRVLWVEAVCPTAAGIPEQWMQPLKAGDFVVGDVPHNEVLLRWTAAIKEKSEKLGKYLEKGIVRPEDSFVIAVNGGQLGRFPLNEGISQTPYSFEAVYPAGPTTLEIDLKTNRVVRSFKSLRMNVENANGEPVPTTAFMDGANAGVSAVFGYSWDRSKTPILTADVVHNHLAAEPVARGLLGPDNTEWGKVSETNGEVEVGKLPK